MRRLSILCLIVAVASLTAFSQATTQPSGQSKCTLTSNQSPTIRGIRLGSSTEQVLTLFPGSREKPDVKSALEATERSPNYGVVRLSFQPFYYPSPAKEAFAGIDFYSVTLFDDRVTEISVRYNGSGSYPKGPFWRSVDDFIAKLSGAYNLPNAKDWEGTSDTRSLRCADFVIVASTSSGAGTVEVHNRSYTEKVKERAVTEEEKMRREFKP